MGHRSLPGFTLIELLVVISIIGILAALVVGLAGLASQKSKVSRVRVQLSGLATAIESYKNDLGSYPRDNRLWGPDRMGIHRGHYVTNQLFYELAGTLVRPDQRFETLGGGHDPLDVNTIQRVFNSDGFMNAKPMSTGEKPGNYLNNLDESSVRVVEGNPDFALMSVSVDWPSNLQDRAPVPGTRINPWRYDVSSTNRVNRSSFDLWAEIPGGKNEITIINNWD